MWSKILISHYTHPICLNNKRIHGGISPALLSDGRQADKREDWGRGGSGEEGGGVSVDLSCQTFRPTATQLWVNSRAHWRAEQMSWGEALEVQPPDFNRLKCKPVSCAVRKQIENFVPLVPDRTRRFSWTRFWTLDTLDAEQDPRRSHEPDTVFFICGFNTMGEFNVGSDFFFLPPLSRMQRTVAIRWGKI